MASDTLLYLFDPAKAMAKLEAFEKEWGGDIATRMATDAARYQAAREAAADPAAAAAHAEAAVANAANVTNAAAASPAPANATHSAQDAE